MPGLSGGFMHSGFRAVTITGMIAAASFAIRADVSQSQSGEIELQLANEFFAEGRYQDALERSEERRVGKECRL